MVQYSSSVLDATFGALADPTRRAILARLEARDCAVGELAAPFAMSLTAVAKHLRVLEAASLVCREKRGRVVFYRLEAARLGDAAAWLEHYRRFWSSRLDLLVEYAERKENEAAKGGR